MLINNISRLQISMDSFGKFEFGECVVSDDILTNLSELYKPNPNSTQTNPVRTTNEMVTVTFGPFQGKTYQELVDEQQSLLKKHEKPLPLPNACGDRCSLPYNFIRWYLLSYRKKITRCDDLPYYVRIRKVRLPDTDPKYPGYIIQSAWEKDPDYLRSLNPEDVDVTYITTISLIKARLDRVSMFPADNKSKHAGKSFDEVANTSPDYYNWIIESFEGRDKVFHDAADWWLENMDVYKMKSATEIQTRVEDSCLTGNETFTSGKYRGRSYLDVYGVNPGYYQWLEKNYQGRNDNILDAIVWYKKLREHSMQRKAV